MLTIAWDDESQQQRSPPPPPPIVCDLPPTEVRDLVAVDASGTSDPVVRVEAYGQSAVTRVRQQVTTETARERLVEQSTKRPPPSSHRRVVERSSDVLRLLRPATHDTRVDARAARRVRRAGDELRVRPDVLLRPAAHDARDARGGRGRAHGARREVRKMKRVTHEEEEDWLPPPPVTTGVAATYVISSQCDATPFTTGVTAPHHPRACTVLSTRASRSASRAPRAAARRSARSRRTSRR